MELVNTFDFHKKHPEISIDDYVRINRILLGKEVQNKTKIYLDTKYWVYFRDVILERTKDTNLIKSFQLLATLCEAGNVICPISEDVFYEITKQTDKNTLTTSIQLIDKLSQGVSLTSQQERIQSEILQFLYKHGTNKSPLYPPEIFAWTKISQTLGSSIPTNTPFSKEDELVMQKAFFDQLWQTPLLEMVNMFGMDKLHEIPRMPDLSTLLNNSNDESRQYFSTFNEIFLDEIYWHVDFISKTLNEAMNYMYEKQTGITVSKEKYGAHLSDKSFTNVVVNLFRFKKAGNNFPTLKVSAGVHAAVRLDTNRKFVANDYYDIRHAQAAIPYCDYFFTEKNLKHLLTMNKLSYDKEFSCEVISKPKDVLATLTKIASKLSDVNS